VASAGSGHIVLLVEQVSVLRMAGIVMAESVQGAEAAERALPVGAHCRRLEFDW
jgi:hypothetical protein